MDKKELEEIRKYIQKSQNDEQSKKKQTQLILENPSRRRVKKLNPKFCFEWSTLDRDQQINRLIEYVSRYMEKNDLSQSTSKKIRKLLVNALVQENLNVEYDKTLGMVTDIPKLYYNHDEGYYLGTYLDDQGEFICRISKISEESVGKGNDIRITTEDFSTDNNMDEKPNKKKISLVRKK